MQSNGRPAVSISEHLLAIPNWPSNLSTLGLTPKDIERTIKRLEDSLIDRIGELSFISDEYEQLTSLIGYSFIINVDSHVVAVTHLWRTDQRPSC